MATRRQTKTFLVHDEKSGESLSVNEFTTLDDCRVIGGGEIITGVEYRILNGPYLEGLMGGDQFVDRSSGRSFRRV